MSPFTARLAVLGAALLFSTGGMAIKATQLGGWQVACLRSAVAAVTLLVLVPAARPPWSARAALVAVAQAATLVLFVLANKLTTSANTIFLQSTAPLYVVVLGPLLLRERVTRRDLGFMALLAVGLLLFLLEAPAPSATATNPALGNVLAALSGVTWAFTIMGLRSIGARGNQAMAATQATALGNLLAALVALPFALPFGPVRPADILVVLALGTIQIALAYTLLSAGVRGVRAFEAAVLLLAEPALNPLWAWIVHGEAPGTLGLAGGVIILAGTLGKAWLESREAA
jgi:drug/metabolite transporter (DMT)-like permease